MKLSTLVNYRTELKKISLYNMQKTVEYDLKKVLYLVNSQSITIGDIKNKLETQEKNVCESINEFQDLLTSCNLQLEQLISEVEQPYFSESYRLYENEIGNETVADIKNRTPNIDQNTVDFYKNRINRYIGWQHPAMIVRPGFEPFINEMVSCDPLYLVDTKHDLLKPATSQFNELYQRRLRTYVVDENTNNFLKRLPDGQFGLVLIYNYFNFRPLEVIRLWLHELLQKLKPGGVVLMTINDCDRDKAVMLVENRYCCYTPGRMIIQLAETLGFETVFQWHNEGASTWIELQKPGQLTTLRGGQSLATIVPKSLAESK
jgi:hypothetical protein